jgi:hypothetical protein
MTEIDYQTRIETTERNEVVFVDKYDDNEVWLSIQVNGGSARTTLTFDQAKEMIQALTKIVEAA